MRCGHCRLAIVALILLLSVSIAVPAQNDDNAAEPVPYSPEEFPQWSRDLRRAEIVTIGMFPLAFLVSRAGYDLGRFTLLSLQRGEAAAEYAPWFLAPPGKPEFTRGEKNGIIVASLSISAAVALVDYLLGLGERAE